MAKHKRSYRGTPEVHMKNAAEWARNFRASARYALQATQNGKCAVAYDHVLNSMDDYAHYSAEREHLRGMKRGRSVIHELLNQRTTGWRPLSKKLRTVIEAYRRKCVPK